ncbi:hypothetical protein [Tellurirhabdus rosea]|uniref:hypothetical protein n=1 Tax=Tellurirhabdus rosea TaxID=2674997 RepID=UPI00225903D3|nr:hypothetical protein [Tellurirhabdus rosea]
MENKQPKANGALIAALVIMTILAGVSSYLLFEQKDVNKNQESTIAARAEELSTTRIKLDSISTALDAKIAEVKKLGGDVTELERVRGQLEQDRAALRRGQRISISKYEAKIRQYEAFLAEKDTLIAQLRDENQVLVTTNQTLNDENSGLKTERQTLTDSVQRISAVNTDLSEKVTRASALRAQNVRVFALNSKGKARDASSDEVKARRVDKIRLQYTLLDNPLTRQEEKEVYIRVLDPSGAVISDEGTGSGRFDFNGQEMMYTAKQTVPYTNNNQNVDFTYTRGQAYKPGKYTVELYAEGFRIGEGSFAIR